MCHGCCERALNREEDQPWFSCRSNLGADTLKQYAEEAKAQAQKEFEPTTSQDVANAEGILPTIGRQISKSAGEPVGGIVGSFGAPVAAAVATPSTSKLDI